MKRKIKNCVFVLIVAVGLVLYSNAVSYATPMSVEPTIIFGDEDNPNPESGQINYPLSSSGVPFFEIAARITAIEGIDFTGIGTPGDILSTAELFIYAQYLDTVLDDSLLFITGFFGAMPGDDFELKASYGEELLLLAGEIDDLDRLTIFVAKGEPTVEVSAMLKLTDGLLLDQFGPEAQLSASINLADARFGRSLFDPDDPDFSGFSGIIEGEINATQPPEPIPEPGTLVLLGLGCAGLIAYRRKKAK